MGVFVYVLGLSFARSDDRLPLDRFARKMIAVDVLSVGAITATFCAA